MRIEMYVTEDIERNLRHVIMCAIGREAEAPGVIKIVKLLTEALKEGKEHFVRTEPTLEHDRDFDTREDKCAGRSRFTVRL